MVLQYMRGLGELLRTSGERVFLSDCTLTSWPWRFWVIHVWVFSGSPSGSECSVLCFRHGDVVLRDLPCSSVGGLHCPGPVNTRQIAWETVVTCGCGQVFLVRLGRRIVGGACRSYLPQVVACRWDRRSPSPSGSGCLGTGVLALVHETVGFVSLGPVALVLFAPCLLCEELAVILVFGGGCGACAHPCEATASGLWSLGSSLPYTGSVVAVLVWCCPVLLAWTDHCFSLGAWFLDLAPSSVACRPSPSHGLAGLCLSPLFEMVSVLFHGNIDLISGESLVPSSVAFDSFSSSSS